MKSGAFLAVVIVILVVFFSGLNHVAERESPLIRMPIDTVGYAMSPEQVEAVAAFADSAEKELFLSNIRSFPRLAGEKMIGAICPHDDYLYAGSVYHHVIREIRAPIVVLFGVTHTARRRDVQDKLIFDDFDAWKGPYGTVTVSHLRESVISSLPPELVLVSNEIHAEEHSLEAFIPFLQCPAYAAAGDSVDDARARAFEILPILVSRLRGPLFKRSVDTVAAVLLSEMGERGMELGRDVVILVSADCVHYGDEAWGEHNYAPYGVGKEGYEKGMAQDLEIIRATLTGTVGWGGISAFREKVERDDFLWPYKITWCGVYSIPFGLGVMLRMSELMGGRPPEGFLMRYGTSLEPGRLPLEHTGLGVTNINTLRHWVGYAAIGYW